MARIKRDHNGKKNPCYRHGFYGTHLYRVLTGMKTRCYNKKRSVYKLYGGRGITICSEWLDSKTGVQSFVSWSLENGYVKGMTIDRIDVNGNYTPENCRWIPFRRQCWNRRSNRIVKYRGQEKSIAEWCSILGYSRRYQSVIWRLDRGWPVEKVFETPFIKGQKVKIHGNH